MPEWIDDAIPYLPFATQVAVLWYLGQFFKKRIWTKERAATGHGFFTFMRETLHLHSCVAGALWGLLWPWLPSLPFVTNRGEGFTYGLLAGFLAMVGHTFLEATAEARGWTGVLRVLRETARPTIPPKS